MGGPRRLRIVLSDRARFLTLPLPRACSDTRSRYIEMLPLISQSDANWDTGLRGGQMEQLSTTALRANFVHWCEDLAGRFGHGSPAIPASLLTSLPTSHTWGNAHFPCDGRDTYLFEKILFLDGALLSKQARRDRAEPVGGTVGPRAQQLGLDRYVFATLGVHDARYGRTAVPPFGVFLSWQAEHTDSGNVFSNNATVSDMDSPEATARGEPWDRHFMLPADSRELASLEVHLDPRHLGDPWRYWAAAEFWTKEAWQWQVELHFLERVPVSQFAAILWPTEDAIRTTDGLPTVDTRRNRGVREFREQYPHCSVIPYVPDRRHYGRSLRKASTSVATFFAAHGSFPVAVPDIRHE